jgi:hypothetical protein
VDLALGLVEADDVLFQAEITAIVVQQHLRLLPELLPPVAHQQHRHQCQHSLARRLQRKPGNLPDIALPPLLEAVEAALQFGTVQQICESHKSLGHEPQQLTAVSLSIARQSHLHCCSVREEEREGCFCWRRSGVEEGMGVEGVGDCGEEESGDFRLMVGFNG